MRVCMCVARADSVAGTSAAFSQGVAGGKRRGEATAKSIRAWRCANADYQPMRNFACGAWRPRVERAPPSRRRRSASMSASRSILRRGRTTRRASAETSRCFDNFPATMNFSNFQRNPHTIGLYYYVRASRVKDRPSIGERRFRLRDSSSRFCSPDR